MHSGPHGLQRLMSALAIVLVSGTPLFAQDQLSTTRSREQPPDSLVRVRLAAGSCGAEIPLVRTTAEGELRDTVFPPQMLDQLPEIRRLPPPRYRAGASLADLETSVILSVLVEASGQPSRVQVVRTSRNAMVDAGIRESIQQAWYLPARRHGRTVAVWMCQTVAVRTDPT